MMKPILKTSLIIIFGILIFFTGIYYFLLRKTYRISKSDTTNQLELPISAGETIPCGKFLSKVKGSEAIRVEYTANLRLRIFYIPDEFRIKEGLNVGLHASFPKEWNYRIFYSDGSRSEDITEFVKNPESTTPNILQDYWGDELVYKLKGDELRNELIPGEEVYQKLSDILRKGDLKIEPDISGIQFNPSGPLQFNSENEAIWSTFLTEAATYRGFFKPIGSINFSLPDKKLSYGIISRSFEVEVPPETRLLVEINVGTVWWKSLYGILIALAGIFIASFPAWWPLIKEFRQKKNK